MRIALLLACSACTISEKQLAPDLACAELPLPTTAAQNVTISGRVSGISGDPLGAGVMIQGFSSGLPLPMTVSDDDGAFSFSHETPGVPTIDHIEAVFPPFLTTITYPGLPVASNTFVDVRMVTLDNAMMFAATAGITIDPMLGFVLLRVTDCNESPLSGATVSSTPAGDLYYFRLGAPDPDATDTDASGIVMIANLTPGDVEISGAADGATLRGHTVETLPGTSFVLTSLQP